MTGFDDPDARDLGDDHARSDATHSGLKADK
jgi:hypothetical protein